MKQCCADLAALHSDWARASPTKFELESEEVRKLCDAVVTCLACLRDWQKRLRPGATADLEQHLLYCVRVVMESWLDELDVSHVGVFRNEYRTKLTQFGDALRLLGTEVLCLSLSSSNLKMSFGELLTTNQTGMICPGLFCFLVGAWPA